MGKMNIKVERELISTVLDKLKSGQLAIPRFQRDFIWAPKQITSFFDSIIKGYPIGSLIFWRPEKDRFKVQANIEGIQVETDDEEFTLYVLDGRQRLTSLISTLFDEGNNQEKFYVNLEDLQVTYWNKTNRQLSLKYITLKDAFDPYKLVNYLSKLHQSESIQESAKNTYSENAKRLNKILLTYEIGYIVVRGGNIEDAVEIFSRLNSKSTNISTDYMVQALAYEPDEDFLFADSISAIKEDLALYNLNDIKRDLVLKCVYNHTDKYFIDAQAEDLLYLKGELQSIMANVANEVKLAARFLSEECGVIDTRLLPYSYQFVMLASFFKHHPSYDELKVDDITNLKRWFFYTTYTSYFTNTSLGEVRKYLVKFENYSKGESGFPELYDEMISLSDMPESFSLSSVRVCGFVLTQILQFAKEKNNLYFDLYTVPNTGKRSGGNTICCMSKEDRKDVASLFKEGVWDDNYQKFGLTHQMFETYQKGLYHEFCTMRYQYLLDNEWDVLKNLFGERLMVKKATTIENKLDKRIERLLTWLLSETSWYIDHPYDIDRLEEVANFVAEMNIPYDYTEVIDFCESLKWPKETATQIADTLNHAQISRYETLGRINLELLHHVMNAE